MRLRRKPINQLTNKCPMKLPSIQQVIQESSRTIRRFPLVIANAVVGTSVALALIDYEGPPGPTVLFKIVFAAILGIPLLISVTVIAEKRKWGGGLALLGQAIAVVLLVGYAFSVPSDLQAAPNIYLIRLLILAAALHFFVAVAPFIGAGGINGFWQYNKALFLRVFTALLFTCVLFAGLSLALAALDHLFGMNIAGKRYAELWVLLVGIFTTWFFLAGVPEEWEGLESLDEYPKGLKVFAQYILVPLVLVYLVILYAYLAKILIDWNWPEGWVGRLVLGFSGTGILALLLLHPIRDRVENVWIRNISRWLYFVLIPLLVMLFLAQWRRLTEYGLTEGRYIGIVCNIWLAAIAVYFIFSRKRNIIIIPGSLCILALAISFGPWGVFSISEGSQVKRLRAILTENSILVNGGVRKAPAPVSFENSKQISSILQYLHEIHGYEKIQPWFGESLRTDSSATGSWYKEPALVASIMGVEYVSLWYGGSGNTLILNADQSIPIDIEAYARMIRSKSFYTPVQPKELAKHDVEINVSREMDTLTVILARGGGSRDSLPIELGSFAERLYKEYGNATINNLAPEKLSLSASNEFLKVKLYLQRLQLRKEGEKVRLLNYDADILYTVLEN